MFNFGPKLPLMRLARYAALMGDGTDEAGWLLAETCWVLQKEDQEYDAKSSAGFTYIDINVTSTGCLEK